MGTLHDTTDAVYDLIAAGVTASAFSLTFTLRQSYDTDLLLEDAGTAYVDVVAAAMSCVADSRVSLQYQCGVDIALRHRFGRTDQGATGTITLAAMEDYIDQLEEIAEYLAAPTRRSLANKTTATWIGNEIRAPWVPDHLRTQRQYTGILRANYVVAKDL